MKTLTSELRSLINQTAHAAGLAREAQMRAALLAELQALADAGAPAAELRAHVAQHQIERNLK